MVGKLMTRQGYKMNLRLRQKIIVAMAARNGRTLAAIGKAVGVNRRTVSDYLTDETYDEIARCEVPEQGGLEDVDKAMLSLACKGNVAAARLVYMRMAQKGVVGPMPTLDEMERELRQLKRMEGERDGADSDDGHAVGIDEAG
jgi:hypothetical protein